MTVLLQKLMTLFARKPDLPEAFKARMDALESQRRRSDLVLEKRAANA